MLDSAGDRISFISLVGIFPTLLSDKPNFIFISPLALCVITNSTLAVTLLSIWSNAAACQTGRSDRVWQSFMKPRFVKKKVHQYLRHFLPHHHMKCLHETVFDLLRESIIICLSMHQHPRRRLIRGERFCAFDPDHLREAWVMSPSHENGLQNRRTLQSAKKVLKWSGV